MKDASTRQEQNQQGRRDQETTTGSTTQHNKTQPYHPFVEKASSLLDYVRGLVVHSTHRPLFQICLFSLNRSVLLPLLVVFPSLTFNSTNLSDNPLLFGCAIPLLDIFGDTRPIQLDTTGDAAVTYAWYLRFLLPLVSATTAAYRVR